MRSALILATLALTILAAPVPKAEGQASVRRHLTDNAAPIESFIDKRFQRKKGDGKLVSSRSIQDEVELEKRLSRSQNKARSEAEDGDVDVEKRLSRTQNKARSEAENGDVNVEKRLSRTQNKARSEAENGDINVEKRLSRSQNKARSEVEDGDIDVEKRLSRTQNKARSEAEDGDVDVEKRLSRSQNKSRSEGVKNTIRNIYDGVVGIVEALKTRGFNSANSLPARQAM